MTLDMLEELKLDFPESEQLNHWFDLAPQGIGSAVPEAGSSFLNRLAHNLSVTTTSLLTNAILPVMGAHELSCNLQRGSSRPYSRPALFNGNCVMTARLINTLEKLTGNGNLRYLTLLPLGELVDGKGVFRKCKAWCALCLNDGHSREATIYEALPWLLSVYKICAVHKVPLHSTCPQCKRHLPIMTRGSIPGFCSRCGCWLGGTNDIPIIESTAFDQWVADNVGALLKSLPARPHLLTRVEASTSIVRHINDNYCGNASKFARDLNISRRTVNHWREGVAFPSLHHLLVISFVTQTPLIDLVTAGITEGTGAQRCPHIPTLFPEVPRSGKKFNYASAKKALCRALRSEEAATVTAIAAKLGYSKMTLYKHFPAVCKTIAKRASSHRALRRDNRIKQECLFVERTAEQLHLDGIYPGYDTIEKLSPKKGILRGKEARHAWHRKLNDLGFGGKSLSDDN